MADELTYRIILKDEGSATAAGSAPATREPAGTAADPFYPSVVKEPAGSPGNPIKATAVPEGASSGEAAEGITKGLEVAQSALEGAVPALSSLAMLVPVWGIAIKGSIDLVGEAAHKLAEGFDSLIEKTSQYSPDVAQAKALNELKQTLEDIEISRRLGPQLGELEGAKGEFARALDKLEASILERFLPTIIQILEGVTALVEYFNNHKAAFEGLAAIIEGGFQNLTGGVGILAENSAQIATNTDPKHKDDPSGRLLNLLPNRPMNEPKDWIDIGGLESEEKDFALGGANLPPAFGIGR